MKRHVGAEERQQQRRRSRGGPTKSGKQLGMAQHDSGYRNTRDAGEQRITTWCLPRWVAEHNRAHLLETGGDVNAASRAQLLVLREVPEVRKNRLKQCVIDITFKDRHVADRADLRDSAKGCLSIVADKMRDVVWITHNISLCIIQS